MNKITRETLLNDLYNLGVRNGDIVFISADLMKVGYFRKNAEETLKDWVEVLLEAVGLEGTIVIPAYTDVFYRFFSKHETEFTSKTPPNSGSLSIAFFRYSAAIRSTHPTNSCFSIGPKAEEILSGHDETSSSYKPYGKVISLGGKNLMLGTVDTKNCPMPFHFVQEKLGHTRKHIFCGMEKTYYFNKQGSRQLFSRQDIGGCTRGVFKSYGNHVVAQAITFGKVGRGLSAYVDTQKSYDVLEEIMTSNISQVLCDDKNCSYCYGRYIYNKFGFFIFWPKKLITKAIGLILSRMPRFS